MNEDINDYSSNSSTEGLSSAESASCNDLLYKDFTHKDMIKRIVISLHESWMDVDDKLSLEDMIISSYGKEMDEAIGKGIKNGYSAEIQEKIVLNMLGAV